MKLGQRIRRVCSSKALPTTPSVLAQNNGLVNNQSTNKNKDFRTAQCTKSAEIADLITHITQKQQIKTSVGKSWQLTAWSFYLAVAPSEGDTLALLAAARWPLSLCSAARSSDCWLALIFQIQSQFTTIILAYWLTCGVQFSLINLCSP